MPFAISSRGILRLNETAKKMFGSGLEKLNTHELPERDEFIVRLEGTNGARFMAFRKLKPGIFTLDDCTDDLNDAQDITWWASVGQAWTREIEAQGGKWQRLSNPPEEKNKVFRVCEWQGEIQGYLLIDMPKKKKAASKKVKAQTQTQNQSQSQNINQEINTQRKPDDVISNIGPQAMALLAAGQSRDHEHEGSGSFLL